MTRSETGDGTLSPRALCAITKQAYVRPVVSPEILIAFALAPLCAEPRATPPSFDMQIATKRVIFDPLVDRAWYCTVTDPVAAVVGAVDAVTDTGDLGAPTIAEPVDVEAALVPLALDAVTQHE